MSYVELQCTSHFSFLRGASSCDELFGQAAELGIGALAITDRNSLVGIVRAYDASRETGVRLIIGCRLDLQDGMSVLVYPMDRPAYARLCRLLSLGKKRAGKGKCKLDWSDLAEYAEGMIAILLPDQADDACGLYLRRLAEVFHDRAYMALTLRVGRTITYGSTNSTISQSGSGYGPSLPTTSSSMCRSDGSSRTSSLASATTVRSTMPASDGSGTPIVI
jgi:DNA polymerase III alpha subunit